MNDTQPTHASLSPVSPSPFHRGEQKIQRQLGVRERMEQFGQKVIRSYLPEQHRNFFQQLSYLLIGHVDDQGWPWASILFDQQNFDKQEVGGQGFIESPHNQQLTVNTQPVNGDPLAQSLQSGVKIGLLGIDLNSRRRNRIAGHIGQANSQRIDIVIDQAFGNCPKYIQVREPNNHPLIHSAPAESQPLQKLDSEALTLIANSDTFFVSSFITNNSGEISEGVDVSHRGGMPSFIRVDNTSKLTIPDYSGNLHFNTLGNFIENPKAGLLFIDFEKGHLLMLTGKVEVLFDSPEIATFAGAERLWTFELDHGLWLKNALPIKWQFQGYSPFLPQFNK